MNKVKINYSVDMIIAVAFVGSALSGLVFLIPYSILPISSAGVLSALGISLSVWSTIHTLSSLAMILGVGLHLALHWKWMLSMTKKYLGLQPANKQAASSLVTAEVNRGSVENDRAISRRRFLALGSLAVAGVVTGWGLKNTANSEETVAEHASETLEHSSGVETVNATESTAVVVANEVEVIPEEVTQEPIESIADASGEAPASTEEPPTSTSRRSSVLSNASRCPKGLVNDPYPGRCRHYVDQDGTGFCDLSEVEV